MLAGSTLRRRNDDAAHDVHLAQLETLQKKYGMRMPSVANHLEERFVKPLSVNHMLARIRPACEDAESGRAESPAFQALQTAVEEYLKNVEPGMETNIPSSMGTSGRQQR